MTSTVEQNKTLPYALTYAPLFKWASLAVEGSQGKAWIKKRAHEIAAELGITLKASRWATQTWADIKNERWRLAVKVNGKKGHIPFTEVDECGEGDPAARARAERILNRELKAIALGKRKQRP